LERAYQKKDRQYQWNENGKKFTVVFKDDKEYEEGSHKPKEVKREKRSTGKL
jgi:hypothetical protein